MKPLLVLNQSQPPAFQHMIELAVDPVPVLFLNGQGITPLRPDTQVLNAPVYDRRSLGHRAKSWASYLLSAEAVALRERAFLLAVTNPPFLPHVAWALSELRGLQYGILIWDIYPGHLHEIGWLRPRSVVSRAWERTNDAVFNRAEFVVTIGEQMARALQQRPTRRQDIQVIPNWADTAKIRLFLAQKILCARGSQCETSSS